MHEWSHRTGWVCEPQTRGIDRTTQDEKLLAAPLSHPEDQFEEAEVEEPERLTKGHSEVPSAVSLIANTCSAI